MDNVKVRCSKCVLPTSTPDIHFDSDGVCSYCHSYQYRTTQGEDSLLEILEKYRTPGKEGYDCLAPVSGGRDSTFLLWKLVHDYNMKPLAVHYDNPFTSPQASNNLESAVKQLGIDLIKWSYPDKSLHEKETRKAIKIWSRKPRASMLPILCAVCKGWWPTFIRIAKENNITLIVIGSNPYESATFKEASFGTARTYMKFNQIGKSVIKGLSELAKNPRYLTCSWPAVIKGGLMASHSSPFVRYLYRDVNIVRLFDHIQWNESEVISTISQNLGWSKDPEHPSPWRFDCYLDHVKKFLYQRTVGVSELEDMFSKFIREGFITREEALKRLETENVTPLPLLEKVLKKIDLSTKELNWPKEWLETGDTE